MDRRELWEKLDQSIYVLLAAIPRIDTIVAETGIGNIFEWAGLSWAVALAPQPFSADTPLVGYNAPALFADALENLEQLGYLRFAGEDGYLPTEKGVSLIRQIGEVRAETARGLTPIPEADLNRLITLVESIIETINALSQPPRPRFETRLRFKSAVPDPAPLLTLLSRLRTVEIFRQDSHCASWQAHNVSAHTWELITVLWREECTGIDDLPAYVSAHGFSLEETLAALKELVARGWIEPANEEGRYRVTAAGSAMRRHAEEVTDRYFFAAWDALSENDLQNLDALIMRLIAYFEPHE